ncbi:ATP-binding protein [Streptomyces longwoodensis]|uniref:ATP-binding protein n=1 Tax=Streptomyces longwoodensis TaxID=68231 RepID=UPI0033F613E0
MSLALPAAYADTSDMRGLTRADGPIGAVAKILRSRGIDPTNAFQTEDRPDDTAEYQHEVYQQAWVNSLRLSGHDDYARFTLDSLDAEQCPQVMRSFVGQLAAARRHNREQEKLPVEQRSILRPKVRHLIAHGTTGSGKTVAAAAAGAFAVQCGLMARFVSHSKYLDWLRPDRAPSGLTQTQVVERYERCDLLILDDLCNELNEYATNHVRTHTSNLITARLNSGRATLFTTNLSFAQVTEVLGDRLASRIGGQAMPVEMVGNDRRKPITW